MPLTSCLSKRILKTPLLRKTEEMKNQLVTVANCKRYSFSLTAVPGQTDSEMHCAFMQRSAYTSVHVDQHISVSEEKTISVHCFVVLSCKSKHLS